MIDYVYGTTAFSAEGKSAVTLGKFDGLHRGHQKLIRRILEEEKKDPELKSVVFTINPKTLGRLLTPDEQRDMLERQGISRLIQCPFIPEISGMEPERFVREILVERLHTAFLAVGTDFRFGRDRAGDAAMLAALGEKLGFRVEIVDKECYGDREISSTYIREALEAGNLGLAAELLGYPYCVMGEVRHGRQIGRTLGMPTINLVPGGEKYLPENGVYASLTEINGKTYPGITNIGFKPTVGESFRGVETYLFDFEQDVYGQYVRVGLHAFERPEQRFGSMEALKEQMHRDILFGKEYFRGC